MWAFRKCSQCCERKPQWSLQLGRKPVCTRKIMACNHAVLAYPLHGVSCCAAGEPTPDAMARARQQATAAQRDSRRSSALERSIRNAQNAINKSATEERVTSAKVSATFTLRAKCTADHTQTKQVQCPFTSTRAHSVAPLCPAQRARGQ